MLQFPLFPWGPYLQHSYFLILDANSKVHMFLTCQTFIGSPPLVGVEWFKTTQKHLLTYPFSAKERAALANSSW